MDAHGDGLQCATEWRCFWRKELDFGARDPGHGHEDVGADALVVVAAVVVAVADEIGSGHGFGRESGNADEDENGGGREVVGEEALVGD